MSNVRISEADFALLQGNLAGARQSAPPATQPARKAKAALPENQVEAQIVGFLRARRWVVKRQHVGKHVPLGFLLRMLERGPVTKDAIFRNTVDVGEKHAADWRAERAIDGRPGEMQVLYVEAKAPGKRPTPEQAEWLRRAQMSGARAGWWDSLDSFVSQYEAWYG